MYYTTEANVLNNGLLICVYQVNMEFFAYFVSDYVIRIGMHCNDGDSV